MREGSGTHALDGGSLAECALELSGGTELTLRDKLATGEAEAHADAESWWEGGREGGR